MPINGWSDKWMVDQNMTIKRINNYCSVRDLTDDQLFYICIPRKLSGGFESRIDNHWKMQLSIMERVIQATKMCRIAIETTDKNIDEVNIESFHILTDSQRGFLLDIIDRYDVNPSRIFIDDYSKEKTIKRQLRLNFF